MLFRDRSDAGRQLAAVLKEKGYEKPLVLGIPRGGVPVAAEVATALGCDLAVVVAHKLAVPGNPELAIGATTATGVSYINPAAAREVGADDHYIEAEAQRQAAEARRREELFDGHRRPPIHGRTVIIVDDGVATGATAIAAIRAIKAEGAERVVLALPAGPPETVARLRDEANEVVCLDEDPGFWAVGMYYRDFSQVSDAEVREVLETFSARHASDPSRPVKVVRDDVSLSGVLTTPAGSGLFPLVIFVHGLGSSKDSPRNLVIANALVEAGFATLLFDLSGHGESSPAPGHGIDAYVADLAAVYSWAVAQPEIRSHSVGIAGSSLGAVVAASAQAEGKTRPQTMVLRAPPMEPDDFRRVGVPSLVLIGSRDPLLAGVRAGLDGCPLLTLSVVAGASHLFDEPGTLDKALQSTVDWFSSLLLQPDPVATPSRRSTG